MWEEVTAATGPSHLASGATAAVNFDRWSVGVREDILLSVLAEGLSYPIYSDTTDATRTGVDLAYNGTAFVRILRPEIEIFRQQTNTVAAYAPLRLERQDEIDVQLDDIVSFMGNAIGLDPERHRYTYQFLSLANALTISVHMRIKYTLACRRPQEFSHQIQPMIPTPLHGSLPSGHATESFVLAHVMAHFAGSAAANRDKLVQQVFRHAERVAINRVIAGVHFPVDNEAAYVLAEGIANYILARCVGAPLGEDGKVQQLPLFTFDAADVLDFSIPTSIARIDPSALTESEDLNCLYERAKLEWENT